MLEVPSLDFEFSILDCQNFDLPMLGGPNLPALNFGFSTLAESMGDWRFQI